MESTSLQPIEHNNQRILTTAQLAVAYGTEEKYIRKNFERNKDHYVLGKHYYNLEGNELRDFLSLHASFLRLQNISKIRTLYLWTEKGALMHAKSLGTDQAWEAYELLVDEYYRLIEQAQTSPPPVVQRVYPWTEEAERLRQINMKTIHPGFFSSAAFVLQKLIYVDLGKMTPNERAKIDISFGEFFPRWLKGDRSGQLKGCTIEPAHPYDAPLIQKVDLVVDSETGKKRPCYHYANVYAGDRDTFWDMWYAPCILPVYFGGKLPDGLPRMMREAPDPCAQLPLPYQEEGGLVSWHLTYQRG